HHSRPRQRPARHRQGHPGLENGAGKIAMATTAWDSPTTQDNSAAFTQMAEVAMRVKQLEEQLHTVQHSLILGFNQLLDLKDLNTGVHSTRLAEWAVRVARQLGLSESSLRAVEIAALLHDIGKIGIPDA